MFQQRKPIRNLLAERSAYRTLRFESFEQRRMLTAVVSVGDWIVADDVTELRLPIVVSGGDEIEGVNLRVQIDDGSMMPSSVPVIADLDLAGTSQSPTVWTGRSNGDLGKDITPRIGTVWTDTLDGQMAKADGILAFIVLDLSDATIGTWSVSILDTLAGSTELVSAPATLLNGSISIVDAGSYKTPVVDLAIIPVTTPTDVSGSPTGESPTLPGVSDDLDEWGPYQLEIWVRSQTPTEGVMHLSTDILYDASLFVQATTAAEPGPAFLTPGSFAAAMMTNGTIHVEASTELTNVGDDAYVLLGRISMIGQPIGTGIDVTADSVTIATSISNSLVQLESGEGGTAVQVAPTSGDFAPVGYDLNDDANVGIADLALFASYFGMDVAASGDPRVAAADYNEDGEIGIADLAWFAANFGKTPGDEILYPNIPAPIPLAATPVAPPVTSPEPALLPPIEEESELGDAAMLEILPISSITMPITPVDADIYFSNSENESGFSFNQPMDKQTIDETIDIVFLSDDFIEPLLD